MNVGLLTSWNERCGIATYAQNLVMHTPGLGIVHQVINNNASWDETLRLLQDCDVVHVNYEPGLFQWLTYAHVLHWRAMGKKSVLTLHTSHEGNNRTLFTESFDAVVVHEKTTDGFMHIPHGIPAVQVSLEHTRKIGTVGFPFPWKGFEQVVRAAALLGRDVMVIAPESRHADTSIMRTFLEPLHPGLEYISEWLSEEETIRRLSSCAATVFAYHGGNAGISGAVRLGIAARRPLVVSTSRQFRDLHEYATEDAFCSEVHIAQSLDPMALAKVIDTAIGRGTVPNRILNDMAWPVIGKRYARVYWGLATRGY